MRLEHVDNRSVWLADRLLDSIEFAALARGIVHEEARRHEELSDTASLDRQDRSMKRVREAQGDYRLARERFVRVLSAITDHVANRSQDLGLCEEDQA